MKFVPLIAFLCSVPSPAQTFPLGQIIEKVTCLNSPDHSYALYLPPNYTVDKNWPVLFLFEPASRATLPLQAAMEAAAHHGFILACTWDTRNYVGLETNWDNARPTMNDVLARFSIDRNRLYAGGFSGGARLACRITTYTGQFAGVVLVGAGLWVWEGERTVWPPPVFSMVGRRDFNYIELLDLQEQLALQKIPHRRVVFDGKHEWAPQECFEEAFAWFNRRAAEVDGQVQGPLPAAYVARSLAQADAFKQQGDLLEYGRRLAFLSDHDAHAAQALRALQTDKHYLKQVKEHEKLIKKERNLRLQMSRLMRKGEMIPLSETQERLTAFRNWKREADRLVSTRDHSKSVLESDMAARLLNQVYAYCFETPIVYFQNHEFEKPIFTSEAAAAILPGTPWPHYNLACSYAQLNMLDDAFSQLDTFVKNGPSPWVQIEKSPYLEPVRQDARYAELKAKMNQ